MKNKTLVFLTFLMGVMLIFVLSVGACTKSTDTKTSTASSTKPAGEVIKLTMGTSNAPSTPQEQLNQKWIEKIEKETNGKVEITLYAGGTLIDMFAGWDQLLSGVANIAEVSASVPGAPFPIANATTSFTYGASIDETRKIYQELVNKFPELAAEYSKVKMLFCMGTTNQYVHTNSKPVLALSDMKGMQLIPSPGYPELLGKLGATGSMMPGGETYPALEKGIVDGTIMAVNPLQAMSIADVTKYSTNLHIIGPPPIISFCMNMDSWNKLPPDVQKVFEDNKSWMEAEEDKLLYKIDQDAIDFSKAKGHEFYELSAADLNTLYEKYNEIAVAKAAALDAKGLPGTAILKETRALVEQYSK
jgi:TRAP-type transport system periplasmic protein